MMIHGYEWNLDPFNPAYSFEKFDLLKDAVEWALAAKQKTIRKIYRMPMHWRMPNVAQRYKWSQSFFPPRNDSLAKIHFIEESGCEIDQMMWKEERSLVRRMPSGR